jgi:hypothetical protein
VFLFQNGQRGSLLVCNWLHFVGQNQFFVMILFIRDSVSFREFIFRVMKILHRFQVREIGSFVLVFWPHSLFGQNHLCV